MSRAKNLRSDIAWSTPTQIFVKGFDLCNDLMGTATLGDMAFLELTDRLPDARESIVFNAMAITLVEHGLTPSALVARLTLAGAPEAMQAAVGAGLAGLGSVFVGSMEDAARVLQSAAWSGPVGDDDITAIANGIVTEHLDAKRPIPGIGHHFHKPVDPRAPRLFELAAANGLSGKHVALMQKIAEIAAVRTGKVLPVNATGAIGALASELGIAWNVVRGIGVMARAIGLVGHIREELANPLAREIKTRTEAEASAHLRAPQISETD